ncbi:MAG: LD-carboxypeptidase [Haliangiales bacterium]
MNEAKLQAGLAILAKRYRPLLAPNLLARDGFLAGSDESRAADFNRCLRDPAVRAIICARGGYGLMRVLPTLDADALRRDPKLLVGFSDATALLAWAYTQADVRGIHGPMVGQMGDLAVCDVEWLLQLMESSAPPPLPALGLRRAPAASAADAGATGHLGPGGEPLSGPLLGGNLCLLSHLSGTPYGLDLRGALLFLEDVGEPSYRLDRYLTHLGLTGGLTGVTAALVGDLSDCPAAAAHPDALSVVHERLAHYQIPHALGAPWGHAARNLALPFGARAALSLPEGGERAPTLTLLEAAVAPR